LRYSCAVLLWGTAIWLVEERNAANFGTLLALDSIIAIAMIVWARLSGELANVRRTAAASWLIGCAVLNACYFLITYQSHPVIPYALGDPAPSLWHAFRIWAMYVILWGTLLAAMQEAFGRVARIVAWGISVALGVAALILGELYILAALAFAGEGLIFAPWAIFAPFLFPPACVLIPLIAGAPALAMGRMALRRGGRPMLAWSAASVFGAMGIFMLMTVFR
jgi:hypothetical protein